MPLTTVAFTQRAWGRRLLLGPGCGLCVQDLGTQALQHSCTSWSPCNQALQLSVWS